MLTLSLGDILVRAIKYLVEGLAVAVAAFWLPKSQLGFHEVVMIALTAAATLAILDLLAPAVGAGTRQGAGFGIGATLVGAHVPIPGVPPIA
jgi:hypothetical protein